MPLVTPPQPELYIGAQELLSLPEGEMEYGWLRKKTPLNKLVSMIMLSWRQVYVIVRRGCVYYFGNENAKKPAGCFSLFGWNRVVRAGDVLREEALWPFKLLHSQSDHKPYYFSAASEQEMRKWMKSIKAEMEYANGVAPRREKSKAPPTGSPLDPEDRDSGSYSEDGSDTYTTIEEVICPRFGATLRQLNDLAEYSSDEEDYVEPISPTELAALKKTPSVSDRIQKLRLSGVGADKPPVFAKPEVNQLKRGWKPLPLPPGEAEGAPMGRPSVAPKPTCKPPVGPKSGLVAELRARSASFKEGATEPKAETHSQKAATLPVHNTNSEPATRGVSEISRDGSYLHPCNAQAEKTTEEEKKDFWSCVYWKNADKETVHSCLKQLAEEGVYCVRDGLGNHKTLDVYYDNHIVKYKIIQKENPPRFALCAKMDFPTLEEMLYYHHSNDLPTVPIKLNRPCLFDAGE